MSVPAVAHGASFPGGGCSATGAHGACGRDSRTAPTTNSTTTNMPSNPVQTLPLSSTTTANGNVKTNPAIRVVCSTTQLAPCRTGRKKISGCRPMINSPATATAAKTASTDVRPSSSQ